MGVGSDGNARKGWGLEGVRRFLVVDDNPDMCEVMARLLEMAGQEARVAYDGPEALQVAREFRPDVVLCDIGLPEGMSGLEVAQAMRSDPELSGAILVALTGFGRSEDRREALAAGFDAHMTKPVDLSAVERVVATGRR